MGIKGKMNQFRKGQVKKAQEELQSRADQFLAEYKVIRTRYQCDFQAYFNFINEGGGIVPKLRIIDITKQIEAERTVERKAYEMEEEAKEAKRIEDEAKKLEAEREGEK